MKLSFHGAAHGVTGSCFLLECAGSKVLVDCGLYQGGREIDEDNMRAFDFDASSITHVLLTHAHLDHCGRLPLLHRRGFRGEVIATSATRDLARIVLEDAARLQQDDADYRRRGPTASAAHAEPLYSIGDAEAVLARFGRIAQYATPVSVAHGMQATFFDAGHILGSASLRLHLEDRSRHSTIVFSGDLGSGGRPVLRDPVPPPGAEVIVMETTYGDRCHRSLSASVDELYAAIDETFARGGNVVIPTFALERAQEVLFWLRAGVESGRIAESTKIFLDSPMAISATEVFRHHPECYDAETAALFRKRKDPFRVPGLRFTRSTAESMAISRVDGGAIILAGSGMATGGRVRHHLRRHLPRADSSVVFVGFAALGTPARRVIDGAKSLTLFGEEVPVRARVHTINGFSAHADQAELLAWHRNVGAPKTFLVHGEEHAMDAFAGLLRNTKVVRPGFGEAFDL